MRVPTLLFGSLAAASLACAALAQPFRLVEVPSVATMALKDLAPQTIAFTDHKDDHVADRTSGAPDCGSRSADSCSASRRRA